MKDGHWDCSTVHENVPCHYSQRETDKRCEACVRKNIQSKFSYYGFDTGTPEDLKRVQALWAARWGH